MDKNKKAFQEAKKYISGGVNSPVRAFKSVGRAPLFINRAKGPYIYDINNDKYLDLCLSWGVHILGHNPPAVMRAVKKALDLGIAFGTAMEKETELAKMIVEALPSVEKIRFVSSGTEAVMSAIRLARGYTGREMIIKFDGCYHGHADSLLVNAGSGAVDLYHASSLGIPRDLIKQTISLPFNDLASVEKIFKEHRNKIAAVIVEPVPANMGVVPPKPGYLQVLREITKKFGTLLIFDEVITGFRLGYSGAQGFFGVKPDLTTLGKIIGGGFPIGAFGGREEIMNLLAPLGDVYQAGTMSGHPLAMTAGIAVLQELKAKKFYVKLNNISTEFIDSLSGALRGYDHHINAIGSMFTIFFGDQPVENYQQAKAIDLRQWRKFYWRMLGKGYYFSPAPLEANFISTLTPLRA